MNRWLLGGLGAVALGLAGWQGARALQNEADPASNAAAADNAPIRAPQAAPKPAAPALIRGVTPMAQREAVIGLLNKRNGLARDVRIKPGQAVRVGDVIIRLRACEQTAPWEPEKLTGAFIQLDVRNPQDQWQRVFSGWLYKESPSLNVVEHQIYDVWPKACTMKWPDVGAETETVSSGASAGESRSSAKKSGEAKPVAEPVASAESSNAT
ncbi:hypothetical protein FHS49_001618 [Sphingobium boeckii]|uniref:DUF2155 domain-containing protein n=1 Tax=Sphingobium boeckii TaxID=1082345 RepID=A0A7W9EF14_9SPHN|nr:hypothetical protein [Sphingobium boeckii]